MKRFWPLLLILPMVVLVSCTSPIILTEMKPEAESTLETVAYEPFFEQAPCLFSLPPDELEGETVICGYVTVPEQRSRPEDSTVQLAVAIFKSSSDNPEPDPLVLLHGGPGEKTIRSAANVLILLGEFRENRDVVVFDQRGVGESRPALECPEFIEGLYDNLDELDPETGLRTIYDSFLACRDRMVAEGVNLAAYNTTENAADVEDIRKALGYEEINLYGGSYGSLLAQAVLRDHPDHIRSVVIGAALPTERSFFVHVPTTAVNATLRLLEQCETDDACNAAYPDLKQVLFDTVEQLNAEPVKVALTDPSDGSVHDAWLTGDGVFGNLVTFLYVTDIIPALPQAIYDVAGGDYELMNRLSSKKMLLFDMLSRGVMFSTMCAEDLIGVTPEQYLAIRAQMPGPLAGMADPEDIVEYSFFGICEAWPVPEADPSVKLPVASHVPVLILEGALDPVTPLEYAQEVAEHLKNNYVYEFPGIGHNVIVASRCARQLSLDFMNDPSAEPDASCIDEMPGVVFDLPRDGSEPLNLTPFKEDGFQGVAPGDWEKVGPGAYLRRDSSLDPTALVYDQLDMTLVDFEQLIRARLQLDSPIEQVAKLEANGVNWSLYVEEVSGVGIDIAAMENDDGKTRFVLLQSRPEERETLYETLFVPAIEAFMPQASVPEQSLPSPAKPDLTVEEQKGTTYADPSGLFSVPVPTNWTIEQRETHTVLASPDGELEVYVLSVPAQDLEQGIADGWALIDPGFDLAVDELIEEPVANGAERAITLIYDTEDDELIVAGGGWLHEGVAYLEMFTASLEGLQKRASQLATISTGYDITALEPTDLSEVELHALDDSLIETLETDIERYMERLDTPGAAVAIVENGEVIYANGFGVRDMVTEEPMTAATQMMIGSTTKSMTTMLMAQLVDEGVFDWATPVTEILPTFRVADPGITDEITMRNMVCACSGVPRRDLEWIFNADHLTAEDIVESLADFEFFTEFGEAFQYSNQMVAAAGYLAALASGTPYGDLQDGYIELMEARVFDAIDMPDTTFSFDEVAAGRDYATPYGKTILGKLIELPLDAEEILIPVAPAGAAWSNVLDMARYAATELSQGVTPDGSAVVSAENLAVTWTPQVDITSDLSYGLGWLIEDWKGIPVISHAGNTFGYSSELAFLPEHGIGISILTNEQNSLLNSAIRYRLLELLFGQEGDDEHLDFYIDMINKGRSDLMHSLLPEIDTGRIEPYLGVYWNNELGEAELRWQDDDLIMDVGEVQMTVRARRDEDGEVSYLTTTPPAAGMPLELKMDNDGNPFLQYGLGVVEYIFERH
ncbi:MAG: alpha/beta fold hydrolase [Chloroflexota bacterium]|nr:alpha/beta fold hydrolase [Chloroflexota bacterium]